MDGTNTSTSSSSSASASGFCPETRTFRSLRSPVHLPPSTQPLSVTTYVLSAAFSTPFSPHTHAALVDASTDGALSYPALRRQVHSLASALRTKLPKGHVAFVLAPARVDVPVLYLALLSIGAVVSPSNPASVPEEISHQYLLTRPSIAFATSATEHLLPRGAAPVILLDSPQFLSMLDGAAGPLEVEVRQSDPAAVMYSSGTTGRVKAVVLSHRNLTAMTAIAMVAVGEAELRAAPAVDLLPLPLFHVFGFSMCLRAVAQGRTAVLMERFDFAGMLRAVERHRVTHMPVSPPLVVAMVKSDLVGRHDLSSLEGVGCGGAPLGRDVAEGFVARFPHVIIGQGYGLTESTAAAAGMIRPEECRMYGSVGRLLATLEAKIVDPDTGDALGPGRRGELWLRGPTIMEGYLGDKEATESTLDQEGWLKTGDLCYFDNEGFLYIVDRLKELIKYKAYQVPPAELEHILHSHPGIADAAVIPYPDEDAGEIPMAYIVRQPGSTLTEQQVTDFVAKKVASYKKIRRVAFISAIPKSAAGKILRRELVKHAVSSIHQSRL